MLIYVDNKKINVNKLESIYIVNQTFGDGIIKYNGITLSTNYNFAYYGIQEKSHLILHGIKGGDSTEGKQITGLILNIIIGVILYLLFVLTIGTGLYTTVVEFLFIIIRDVISGQLLNHKYCSNSIPSKIPERFSHKLLKVMITIIFIIFSILLIYYSVYIFANLVSLIFLYTSKKILNLVRGIPETDTELLCDSLKNATWVGSLTAGIYTGIYYILRIPNALLEFIENKAPFEIKIFNPILNAIDIGVSAIKDTLVLSIPVLGEVIDGYLGAIGSAIEMLWSTARLFRDETGDPLNNYFFSCNSSNSLDKLYELFEGISTGTGSGAELQEVFTDARLMTWINILLGKTASDISIDPEKLNKFRKNYQKNGRDSIALKNYTDKYIKFVKGRPLRKYIINILFTIVCQIFKFGNVFGIKILEFSPTFEKPLDMISDGLYSGMISVIVFVITLLVLFIKNLF